MSVHDSRDFNNKPINQSLKLSHPKGAQPGPEKNSGPIQEKWTFDSA